MPRQVHDVVSSNLLPFGAHSIVGKAVVRGYHFERGDVATEKVKIMTAVF